ncbi:MAG: hypothetical protein LBF86_05755 [Helicobacteraceae bacterium]|nr:hypothetical protein [Helicobacteraceae bacterium]
MSLFDDDDEAKWRFIKSFAATQATVHSIKAIVQEKRPDGSNRASFPSGRSAAFIHRRY